MMLVVFLEYLLAFQIVEKDQEEEGEEKDTACRKNHRPNRVRVITPDVQT